jgi:hypothetical protein
MGIAEEGGKVANKAIDIFGQSPLVLALVVMNMALIGFVYYQGVASNTLRRDNVTAYLQQVKETQELLSRCVVPGPRGDLDHLLPKG